MGKIREQKLDKGEYAEANNKHTRSAPQHRPLGKHKLRSQACQGTPTGTAKTLSITAQN